MDLPLRVVAAINKSFPDTGNAWLERYPKYLAHLLERWQLTIEGRAETGWPTNVVYFVANQKGGPMVLKLGHPHPESTTERLVLNAANHQDLPIATLIDSDSDGNALLLKRIVPGTLLRESIRNGDDIRAALNLHQQLPRAAIKGLPRYETWMAKAFTEYRAGTEAKADFLAKLTKAEELFASLSQKDFLLHGDLHHENILKGPTGWVAIDPKGVIGPKEMELRRFFHNFMEDEAEHFDLPSIQQVYKKRFELGSEVLPYSVQQLMEITFIDLTLALTWHINSDEDATRGLISLGALEQML